MALDDVFDLEQYTPSDWGAAVDYDRWRNRDEESSQWFIHWPGFDIRDSAQSGNVNGEKAQLRDIESYTMEKRGFAGIPYDWAVGQSGTLYRLRGRARSAATSGDVDKDGHSNNYEGEALLFLVDTSGEVSDAALATAAKVIEVSGYTEVYAHADAGGTTTGCPGPTLRAWVADGHQSPQETSEDDTGETTPVEPARPREGGSKPKKKPSKTKDWTEEIVAALGVHRKGDRGPRIRRIQALLNLTGMHSLKVDGIFGPKTEEAVAEYQQHFRLVIDGVVGPKTWGSLLLSERY